MSTIRPRIRTSLVAVVRRAWALIGTAERRRLILVGLYGVLIAGLDTIALLLVFALINVLNNAPVSGIAGALLHDTNLYRADRYETALLLLVVTAILFIARSLLSVLGLWLTIGATNAAQTELFSRLLTGHAHAPQLLQLERNSSETLRTVMTSASQVTSGIVAASVTLVSNLAVAAAVALALVMASPLVATAAIAYFAIVGVAWTRLLRKTLTRRGRRAQELQEELLRLVMQSISASKELQLRGRALFYVEAAVARTRGINSEMRGAFVANGSLRYMLETSLVVGAGVVIAVAGAVSGRTAALPAVGLVLAGAFRLLPALNQILFLTNQVQFNSSAVELVEREMEVFGAYGEPRQGQDTALVSPLPLERELTLHGVTFTYPSRNEPALHDVDLSIRSGEALGIVGPTGSGKSTLLNIVIGFLDPEAGRIEVDERPLSDCREAWQRSIGYVPQDVYLVDESLRANIALGWRGSEIDDEAVAAALRLAGLEEVVAQLPAGLETVVGERGVRLSGGQRQRVGIARALYTRPRVLVLDEATSNLDAGTERRIVDTLAALPIGTTMIVVTHRTASVRRCDRIVYLEAGAVRAEGTYEEVSAAVPGFGEQTAGGTAIPSA